jgi:hypothetical protein
MSSYNPTTDSLPEGAVNKYNQTHTGDVTGSEALTIASDAVTYDKMQDTTQDSILLGRGDSGAGTVEELTVGVGLDITGTVVSSTSPSSKAGEVPAVNFVGVPIKKATVTFTTAFADANYAVSVIGEDNRSWIVENKTASSFVISANSAAAISFPVMWIAVKYGES